MIKRLCVLFLLVVMAINIFSFAILADGIELYNNNVGNTNTKFSISSDGIATVNVNYSGYSNITTEATITITIEKRNLLLFWSDVVSETITVSGDSYSNVFDYQFDDTGTYRCTVEYVVSGTGGADDVITFEDTKEYK